MKKFEYKITSRLAGRGDELDILNEHGQQGWELVNVSYASKFYTYYWKRSLPATSEEGEEKQ